MLNKNWFAALMVVTACGSDDDDKGGSGVDGNRKGSSLTAEEAKTLCESVRAEGPSTAAFCAGYAATFTTDKAACDEKARACIDELDREDPCVDAKADFAGCELTVKELETCLNAQGKLLSDALDGITCGDAGGEDLPDIEMLLEEVPSECKNVKAMCPAVL